MSSLRFFSAFLLFFLLPVLSIAQAQDSLSDITVIPESERTLDVLVLGLAAQDNHYYELPDWRSFVGVSPETQKHLECEFYGLNFEINQGAIMRRLPERTQVYIAVPDSKVVKESRGNEIPFFKQYLRKHCGWTAEQIVQRIHFFKVPTALIWAQDAGDILGTDKKGRVVIGIGKDDQSFYVEFVKSLAKAYPDKFSLYWFPQGVTSEGGDENLALTPDGKPGYAVGIHRVLFYLYNLYNQSFEKEAVGKDKIEEARQALSQGFLGLPLLILPEKALRKPSLADSELFHLDMMVSFLSRGGKPQAFVPVFQDNATDMMTGQPLDSKWLKHMGKELDLVAEQLQEAGYPVYRLPFADHPVRSPANLLKYYDPKTQADVILMSKYPYHLDDPKIPNGVKAYHALLGFFGNETAQLQNIGGGRGFEGLQQATGKFWTDLLQLEQAPPNPLYEQRANLFKSLGYQVVDVPMFPCGAGSIHCMTLH